MVEQHRNLEVLKHTPLYQHDITILTNEKHLSTKASREIGVDGQFRILKSSPAIIQPYY